MAASQRQIYNISELGSDPCSEREQFGQYMAILWYSRGKKSEVSNYPATILYFDVKERK